MHGILDEFKQFKSAPPGNRPEWMPMDTYLNKDIHEEALEHAGYTKGYDANDPRKFRLDTPRHLESTYLRVWTGCLSLARIRKDIRKFEGWVVAVHLAKGTVLTNVSRDGWRRELGGPGGNRGGPRTKKERQPDKWAHEDAIQGREMQRSGGRVAPTQ